MAPKALAKSKPCGAGFSRFGNERIELVHGSSGLLFHPGNIPIYIISIYIYVGYEGHLRIIFPKIPGTSKQHMVFLLPGKDPGPWVVVHHLHLGTPPATPTSWRCQKIVTQTPLQKIDADIADYF